MIEEPYEQPRGSELSQIIGSPDKRAGDPDDEAALSRRLMAMARAAVVHANSTDLGRRRAAMARSNESYRNEHNYRSKYTHKNYSARSRLFIPKTRSAVKNKLVAVRGALFSTDDAVTITAEDDTDPQQQASAELNMSLLNYRFDRATGRKAGIPWMKLTLGAAFDCCVAGIAVAKTSWEFEERIEDVGEEGIEEVAADAPDPFLPSMDPNVDLNATVPPMDAAPSLDAGLPMELPDNVVGMSGLPVQRTVIRDRPMIYHIEPENVIVDMAAPWWDVFQDGQFLIVKHPMKVGDVKAMMRPGAQHMGGGPWFDIPDKVMATAINDTATTGVRTSRTGNEDRYGRSAQPSVNDFEVVWVHENFVRVDGIDYHFWSLGTRQLLSEPGETGSIGHYPAHRGERPYVMGVGQIEPHVAIPMSHVESWRPLQDEINDSTNLRIDAMKQAIAPITLYRMGANVDLRAVRERGPDATIGVSDLDKDIRFQPIQGPNPTIYAEMDRLNSQFDELAGSFATSTVQSSRAIGETARGMQLVNSAANTVQDFDLSIFIETWAEPVIRHIVWLEQYYETDQNLLTLLAKKANLYQRFGQDLVLDEILDRQLTTKVSVGPGAGDPVQKLQRLNAAIDVSLKVAPLLIGQVQPKAEEILSEIFGPSGVSAQRLFTFISPEEAEAKAKEEAAAQPNPDQMKIDAQMQADQMKADIEQQRIELEREQGQLEVQIAQEKNQVERERLELERAKIAAEIDSITQEGAIKQQGLEFERTNADRQFGEQQRLADREHETQEQRTQREFGNQDREFQAKQGQVEREDGHRDREFAAKMGQADRDFGFKEREFDHQRQTGRQDFGLRSAAHNKQLMDEAAGEPEQILSPQDVAPSQAMPSGVEILSQAVAQMAQSTGQIGQALTAIAQMQQQNAELQRQQEQQFLQAQQQNQQILTQMMQMMNAPKRVIYGEDGRVQGVESANGRAN